MNTTSKIHEGCVDMVLIAPVKLKHTMQVREKPTNYPKQKQAKEKEKLNYTKHDLLFKQLINNFFEEFLEAFFPDVHQHVDFAWVAPMPQEVHSDLIDGKTRRLDIVVETKLKGEDTTIIIHIEPQSYVESNFHERMYHYFSLLYNEYRKPILPIVVFSYEENHEELNEFNMDFSFFHVLTFRFLMLELSKKKNWRDYVKSDNPVAAALLSKMGYKEEEKVQVKMEFLRMLVRMELDPAKSKFILDFFETYLKLSEEEEERLMEKMKHSREAEEILELTNSWEERGIKKGKEEGIEEGREQATKELVLELLKAGSSIEFIAKITRLDKKEIEKLGKTLK